MLQCLIAQDCFLQVYPGNVNGRIAESGGIVDVLSHR